MEPLPSDSLPSDSLPLDSLPLDYLPLDYLPLDPPPSLVPLDRPFTRAEAAAAGVERRALERLLAQGTVRRLVRGAYVAADVDDTPELRATAVALVSGAGVVAVDRSAAWVHGVDVLDPGETAPRPVETQGASRATSAAPGGRRRLAPHDVGRVGGLLVTTPLRTALDLGRLLPAATALGMMDRLLAEGSFTHVELLAELPRFTGQRGVAQLRHLAAQADGRSVGMAESRLRLHWHLARLPTATPGLRVLACGRLVRLALGDPVRRFGAVLAERAAAEDLVALDGAGWRVVVLGRDRVLRGDPGLWVRHLECEFHQHLLVQAG